MLQPERQNGSAQSAMQTVSAQSAMQTVSAQSTSHASWAWMLTGFVDVADRGRSVTRAVEASILAFSGEAGTWAHRCLSPLTLKAHLARPSRCAFVRCRGCTCNGSSLLCRLSSLASCSRNDCLASTCTAAASLGQAAETCHKVLQLESASLAAPVKRAAASAEASLAKTTLAADWEGKPWEDSAGQQCARSSCRQQVCGMLLSV